MPDQLISFLGPPFLFGAVVGMLFHQLGSNWQKAFLAALMIIMATLLLQIGV